MNLIKKYLNKKTIIFTMIAMLLLTSATLAAGSIVKNPHESEYGKFVLGPEMKIPRYGHHAVLLDDGRVLVVGGVSDKYGTVPYAEIYDPTQNVFILGPKMSKGFNSQGTITLLQNGNVLCVYDGDNYALAEIYEPTNNNFILLDYKFPKELRTHTATLLKEGRVLIVGGSDVHAYHKESYLYDPETQKITRTGDLHAGRRYHKAVLLDNDKVWIVSGQRDDGKHEITELYDPKTGKFEEYISISHSVASGIITKLNNGKILFSGGSNENGITPFLKNKVYDFRDKNFEEVGSLIYKRFGARNILFPNNKVMFVGGGRGVNYSEQTYSVAEVYDLEEKKSQPGGKMHFSRKNHTTTMLKNGKVIVIGGRGNADNIRSRSEFFIPLENLSKGGN